MARTGTTKAAKTRAKPSDAAAPPSRLRCPLNTVEDVRTEMAKLYREGKAGRRDVTDVSKLANVLAILGRLIEASEFEKRLAAIEAAHSTTTEGRTWSTQH